MLFNSIHFFLFFPVVTVLYYLLPHRFRSTLLLFASCVFYMVFIPKYILVLLVTILIDYTAGIRIEKTTGKERKMWLYVSVISTVLVLFIFKYFNFFNANLAALAGFLHWNYSIGVLRLILPIGLSFHTFQSLSYVIEVYRGKQKAEYDFGIYALYVMFYPQLVAGPIERPQNLLHQFYERHHFEYDRVIQGLRKMLWGMFKKVVIADNAAVVVNMVYNDPHNFAGFPLIIATVFFAFQIYCDFSGYSDIAIGAAGVMGFRLSENFNRPYFSQSISEFWKRWHISLSSWFRDYVYIPLGGSRVALSQIYTNLLITFILSGLWHGANWTFIAWGALNGIYLAVEMATKNIRGRLSHAILLYHFPKTEALLRMCTTFALICFSWIFFRAGSMADALYVVSHLLSEFAGGFHLGIPSHMVLFVGMSIFFLVLVEALQGRFGAFLSGSSRPATVVRWGAYYAAIGLILYFLNGTTPSQFIYFQF
jgi:alginate O-acetyltransferase complex protein AlgI